MNLVITGNTSKVVENFTAVLFEITLQRVIEHKNRLEDKHEVQKI